MNYRRICKELIERVRALEDELWVERDERKEEFYGDDW